jgi:uncharacterized protein YjiS (DUF1127 family)
VLRASVVLHNTPAMIHQTYGHLTHKDQTRLALQIMTDVRRTSRREILT